MEKLINVTTNEQGINFINAKDLYLNINPKTRFNCWIKHSIERADLEENIDYFFNFLPSTGGRPATNYELTLTSAKIICSIYFSRNKKSLDVYKYLKSLDKEEVLIKPRTRKEELFYFDLCQIFNKIVDIIPQYSVLNYKIDFYIPKINLAIEYDEIAHVYYKNDDIRQKEIQDEIKCEFIRIKEGDELKGINNLLSKILRRTIYEHQRHTDLTAYGEYLLEILKTPKEKENELFIDFLNSKEIEERKNIFNESNNLLLIK
jgi:phage anti-repressor protein/very-short-patch-repair endonuclease